MYWKTVAIYKVPAALALGLEKDSCIYFENWTKRVIVQSRGRKQAATLFTLTVDVLVDGPPQIGVPIVAVDFPTKN